MQHNIKPGFAKNTRYVAKFLNYEVKRTWISSLILKFKPKINYCLFFYKDFAYLSKKLLN